MMRSIWPIIVILLAACGSPPPGPDKPAADAADTAQRIAIMNAIDLGVALPKGAGPLASYERHYAWDDAEHRRVRAVFLSSDLPGRSWQPLETMPFVLDGGCSVITIVFDVARNAIASVACNGY
jgi:hypothetical protein